MVKNTKGGNKSKGFARKLLTAPTNSFIRLPQNPLESFALVTKMFGTICEVFTLQQQTFNCHIRGKFRGRNKRSSFVSLGSIVLIGFRDFEAPLFKNTDLLEIYDSNILHSLFITPGYQFSLFLQHPSYNHNISHHDPHHDHDDHFTFSHNIIITHPPLQDIPTPTQHHDDPPTQQEDHDDIDFHDI